LELPREQRSGPGSDFITGYTLGLIGGVRSWMTRSRQTNRDSHHQSDDDDDDSEQRGESGSGSGSGSDELEDEVDAQIGSMIAEGAKRSGD